MLLRVGIRHLNNKENFCYRFQNRKTTVSKKIMWMLDAEDGGGRGMGWGGLGWAGRVSGYVSFIISFPFESSVGRQLANE